MRRQSLRCRYYLLLGLLIAAALTSCDGHVRFGAKSGWTAGTGEFYWTCGAVTLPRGWTYQEWNTGDSFSGSFVTADGESWIGFDFGPYAGLWATPGHWLFEEAVVDGARVWTASQFPDEDPETPTRYAVTFPDCGEANFFMYADDIRDTVALWAIARSFRPVGPVTRIE